MIEPKLMSAKAQRKAGVVIPTKKQRNALYLKALESKINKENGLCHLLKCTNETLNIEPYHAPRIDVRDEDIPISGLPEMDVIIETTHPFYLVDYNKAWEIRETILCLAIAMD